MKKLLYIFLLVFAASCQKELELSNPNELTTADFWKTEGHATSGCIAMYNTLLIDGTYMRMVPVYNDGRGDDTQSNSPWSLYPEVNKFIVRSTQDPIRWVWHAHYIMVSRANQVLDQVPSIVMDEALKARILAQAYFIRGLAYFNLVNFYYEVPLVLKSPKTSAEYYPATASNDEVWAQVISDFTAAQKGLPITYRGLTGSDAGQVGRATKGAATGMLGKAYLYRKQWQLASNEFSKLISGPDLNVYKLVDNYRDNFGVNNSNNSESLFEVQFATPSVVGGTDDNWGGTPTATWKQISGQARTISAPNYGWADYYKTPWVYNEYKIEKTIAGKSDPRLLATIASYEPADNSTKVYNDEWPYAKDNTKFFCRKYTNDGLGLLPSENTEFSGIHYRILRYSDILMMQAEALNELGQTAAAYPLIQQVRSRAKLADLSTTKPGMTQEQMRDQIGHERMVEFSGEGTRIYDIIRWGWLYKADKLAELRSHDSDFDTWIPGHEFLPIPQGELDVNKNLKPNLANASN